MEPDWSGVHFTLQRLYWQESKCIVAAALSISSSTNFFGTAALSISSSCSSLQHRLHAPVVI
jgi:hypothetical protein